MPSGFGKLSSIGAPSAAANIHTQFAEPIARAEGAGFKMLGETLLTDAMAQAKEKRLEKYKIDAEGRRNTRDIAKEGREEERVLGKEKRGLDSAVTTRDEQREYDLAEETRKGVLGAEKKAQERERQIGYLDDAESPEAKKDKIATDKAEAELENKKEDTRLKKAKADAGGFAGKTGKSTSKKYKNEDGSAMTMESVKENRQVWKEENRDRYDKGEVKELQETLKGEYEDAVKEIDVDGIDYFNKSKVKAAKSALKAEYDAELAKIDSSKQLSFDAYMKGIYGNEPTPKKAKKQYTYTKKN